MVNKQKSRRQRNIKSKLMAAICMLLVSSIMMVSTTYAWFTLSTAPEVKGITTAVGANGNLEIALLKAGVDFGNLNTSIDTTDTYTPINNTWGNLVDVSDTTVYGLDKITLYPSKLQTAADGAQVNTVPLAIPAYGADGRMSSLKTNATMTGTYTGGTSGSFQEKVALPGGEQVNGYGVRAVGSASGVSERELSYRSARQAASNSSNAAASAASAGLQNNGNVLAEMAMSRAMEGKDSFGTNEKAALVNLVAATKTALGHIETAIKCYIKAEIYGSSSVADGAVEGKIAEVESAQLSGLAALSSSNAVKTAVTQLQAIAAKVSTAETKLDELEGDTYTWGQLSPIVSNLADTDAMEINGIPVDYLANGNGDTTAETYRGQLVGGITGGLVMTLGPGGGVYADIAEFSGDYGAMIIITRIPTIGDLPNGMTATMNTSTTTRYLAACNSALSYNVSGGASNAPISDFSGYIIDMAFRTNAMDSSLLLQTEAVDRIYSDNTANDATMGGGSTMSFKSIAQGFDATKVHALMTNIRVVFFETDTMNILRYAKLDAENANMGADGTVTMDLVLLGDDDRVLDQDNAVITPLVANTAKAVSVLVYLDGERVTNADVAATAAQSMTGSMNLQFSSTATLVPMEYTDLRRGGSEAATPEVPQVTTADISATFQPDTYTGSAKFVDAGTAKAIVATINGVTDATGETVTINGSEAEYGTVPGTTYSGWYVIVTSTPDAADIAVTPATGG